MTTRVPYRPAHLANGMAYVNSGMLLVGGATPDSNPAVGEPYSAYWVWSQFATPATITAFMSTDPYVQNNLVKFFRISNLTVPNVNTGAAYSLINPGVDAATNALATNTAVLASPAKTFTALFYVYGADIFTTRTPYRTGHLMNANTYVNQSLVVIGGAYPPTDPQPYGAMFVFNENANASTVTQFMSTDPYVQNSLVVRHGGCSRAARMRHARTPCGSVLLTALLRGGAPLSHPSRRTSSYFTRNWSVPIISPSVDAATVAMYSPPPPSPPPSPPMPPPSPPSPPPPVVYVSSAHAAQPVMLMLAALLAGVAVVAM